MTETQRESFFTPSEPAMYCDRLRCGNEGEKPPLVLVHGAGHNGACYLQTPDGRPGWAQYFAQAGYDVYVPDWPGMGRSGRMEPSRLTGGIVAAALGVLLERLGRPAALLTHSMSGAYGWKVLETHAHCIGTGKYRVRPRNSGEGRRLRRGPAGRVRAAGGFQPGASV